MTNLKNLNIIYEKILIIIYKNLSNNIIFQKYIMKIKNIYTILKPIDENTISIYTIKLFLKIVGMSIIMLIIGICIGNFNLYYFIILCAVIYIITNQTVNYKLKFEENKLLMQFEVFINNLRHCYYIHQRVEDALLMAIEDAEYDISIHINKIYDILLFDDIENINNYCYIAPNKYFSTFLAICRSSMTYGDCIFNGNSTFLNNLEQIRNEINIEILKRKKTNHVFSGLVILTIIPIFFLKIIEKWALSNLPDLEKYYKGSYGAIVMIIMFLITIMSYSIVSRLKEEPIYIKKDYNLLKKLENIYIINKIVKTYISMKNTYKLNQLLKRVLDEITIIQFYIRKFLIFITVFLFSLFIIISLLYTSKKEVINYIDNITFNTFFDSKQIEDYKNIIRKYADKYKNNFDNNKELIIKQLNNETKSTYVNEILYNKIEECILKYNSYKFKFLYFIISFIISYIFCNIPYFLLYIKKYMLKSNMENEVMQFYVIIIMLMHIERMNVETILLWLENFADIFKDAIGRCIDRYSYNEEEALERLKLEEDFPMFVRIVENLEACDSVGIESAFFEIDNQKEYFLEKRKQDNEINISNKGVIAKVIAYIPLIITLFLYLIIPFALESINNLSNYVGHIQDI